MKKHLTLLLLAAFMALSGTIGAQPVVVTVGNGTTNGYSAPFNNLYKNSYNQMVYSSQSLTAAGMTGGYIGAIAYDCAAVGALTLDEIVIYMGTTANATIASTAVASLVPMANLTQVFHATNYAMPSQTGWFQIVLDSPFQYNPATDGNLAIVVCKKASAYASGLKFNYTAVTDAVAYRQNDADTNYFHFPTGATTLSTNLPNIQFTVNASSTFCFPPNGLAVSDANSNSINVSWNANDAASYQIAIAEAANQFDPAAASWNTTSATSYTFTSLTPNTAYKVYLRTVCSDNPSAPAMINVATTSIPATLPYVASFEDDDTTGWAFANGGLANYWVIDTATHCGENSTRALYITNGTESHPNEYTISSSCAVFAYRPITFGESGQYDIAFDWKANGEGSADFLRAALVPASVELTAGTAAFSGLTASATPDGWIPLDGGGKLNLVSDWQHQRVATPVAAGTYNIVFYWRNDASVGTRPPAAVDNISIAASVCPGIDSVYWETTETTATITSHYSGTPSEFMLIYQARDAQEPDTVYSYSGVFNLTDIAASSYYDASIYTICGADTTFAAYDFNFKTDCAIISEFPWDYGFENATWFHYTSGCTTMYWPYCWNAANKGGSTTYNWRRCSTVSNTRTGDGAAYFYSTTTATAQAALDEWLKTPTVELTGNEQLSFWVRGLSTTTTANYHTRVSVRVSPEDTLDADSLYINVPLSGGPTCNGGYYTDLTGTTYTQYFADLSGLSGNRRIAFVVDTNSYSFYMDDLRLVTVSNCPDAFNVRVEGYTSTTANLAWSDTASNPTTTSWDIYYGTPGFSADTVSPITVYDTTYVLEGLEPQTDYEYFVIAHCSDGSDANATTPLAFTTACAAVSSDDLPYVEDFEAYGTGTTATFSPCWTKTATQGSYYPYPYSTAAIHGDRGLYFYSYLSTTAGATPIYDWATLPLFETDINALRLRFNTKRYTGVSANHKCRLYIGVMSDPYDISTFDTVAYIDHSDAAASSIAHEEICFDQYEGEGTYIAIMSPIPEVAGQYNHVYLDDVVVDSIPDCRRSTNLTAENITINSADLSWNNTSVVPVSNYTVAYSTNSDFDPATCTTTEITSATNLTLTGLNSYTRYYWAVRANCSDNAEWSNVATFMTPFDCGPGNVENILDTLIQGATSGYTYTAYANTSYPKGKTYMIFNAQELMEMGLQTNNVINSISLQSGTTGGTINHLSIYMAETDLDEFSSTPANDTMAMADMQLVYSGDKNFEPSTWNEIVFDSAYTYSGTQNLVILLYRDTVPSASTTFLYGTIPGSKYRTCYGYQSASGTTISATRAYYRDNIAFNICTTIPSCERPDNVTLTDLQPTSASFSWIGTASNYEVAYGPQGIDPDSTEATFQLVATNTFTMAGLSPQTTYDFYVRSRCSNLTDTSNWTFLTRFTTPCLPQALPYSEDFESYASGAANPIDPCWTKGTNSATAYPYPYATNPVTGQRSLYFYANHPSTTTSTAYYSYAALPMMDAPVDSLMVSFKMRRYSTTSDSYTSRIVVGLMSDPSDITTFTAVDTFDLKNEASLSVHGFEVSFAGHTDDGQFIAFYDEIPPLYGSGTSCVSYVYLDDVVVDYIPTCPRPINVTISDSTITGTTAVVSWTDRVVPSQGYELEYGIAGFTLGTGTRVQSNTNPTTLTGLQHSSQYEVYVRALCSATDMGEWSFATTFYTTCEAISSLPITYDLEDFTTGTSAEFPLCWTRINDATGTTNYYPYVYSSTTYAHSGSNCLYFYATSTSTYASNMYAVLPEVNTTLYPANTLEVVFWGRGSSTTTYDASIIVGMMTNPADATTFVAVDTIQMDATLTEYTVPFSNYTGNGGHIAFYKVRGTTTGYAYIDDITIEQQSACARPYDLVTTGATPTSATVDWTDSIGASQWVIEYRAIDSTTIHSVTVTSHPYTITGLQPSTSYTFHVAARCPTVADVSDFSREWLNFATSQIPAAVPYFYNFESADEWNNWQTVSNQTTNWYRGTAEASDGSYSMYVSMDDGATRSTNMAQVINACAYRDIDFGSTPASYELTIKVKVGGTVDANYDGVAILLEDPSTYVEASSTSIVSPWGHVNDHAITTYRRDTNWNVRTCNLDNVSGVKRLVFYWFNQATGASHVFEGGPAAVDSISVNLQPCQRPYDLEVTNITTSSARLSWSGVGTDFLLTYRVAGAPASTNITIPVSGQTHYMLTSLSPATQYYFWVRKVCDSANISNYSDGRSFTTACGIFDAADTLYEDFESITGTTYSTAGDLPQCWEGYSNGTSDAYIPHVVDSGAYWYTASGTNCVMLTSGSTTTYGNTKILRLPIFAQPVNTLTLSYWMCTESSSSGTLYVGYMTGDDYETDFVPVKSIPASTATIHSGTGLQSGAGVFDTVTFDSVPATAQYLAFKWFHDATFYSCALDNIQVTSSYSCMAPEMALDALTATTAQISWPAVGNTQLTYKADTDSAWADLVDLTANTYTLTGLMPNTDYQVRLRKVCDSVSVSEFATLSFTTPDLPCPAPTNLHQVSVGFTEATVAWTAEEGQSQWQVVVVNGLDTIFEMANANNITVGNLYNDMDYSVSVRAMCAENYYGEWSDTILVHTLVCDVVENLTVSDIAENSAVVSWNGGANNTGAWQVNYGDMDFMQGTGEMVDVTTSEYTITGLVADSYYDVYVRAKCTANVFSNWSQKVDFHTLAHTGINDVDAVQVSLYPNPSNGNAMIDVEVAEGTWSLQLIDMQGRQILAVDQIEGRRYELKNLASGAYFVRIATAGNTAVKKLMVK